MKIILCIIAIICAGLQLVAAMTQLKSSKNKETHILMIAGAVVVLAGVVLCLLNSPIDYLFALVGFGLIAYAAIQNGRNAQKVHIRHHVVRIAIFLVLVIEFFFY